MAQAVPTQIAAPTPVRATIRGRKGTYALDDLGLSAASVSSSDFSAKAISESQRAKELAYRERFYRAQHHDQKTYDFNGRVIRPGTPSMQPLLSGGTTPSFYVPLDQRRPSSPYRLPRVIVSRFTGLVFGYGRWPKIRVVGDPDTEDMAEALAEAAQLRAVFVRARNMGGSCGTVGLSWKFVEGKPFAKPHSGKYLWVQEWEDRDQLAPAHVIEIYKTSRDEFDPKARAVVSRQYWHRRDWTTEADVAFVETPCDEEERWTIDEEETFVHGDGFAHFVWIQNHPSDDDAEIDGQPDYADLYENFNHVDILNSAVGRGTTLNVDPTLVLKLDPTGKSSVRKGSDQALWVGETGDAKYLELQGTSIEVGNKVLDRERGQALEVAQCVTPDPDTLAAAGTSRVALELIYEPMLTQGDVLRVQYGDRGILVLLAQMLKSARRQLEGASAEEVDDDAANEVEIDVGDDGAEAEDDEVAAYALDLPKRVVTEDMLDDHGEPTGEVKTTYVDRKLGAGGTLQLVWPPYFRPTPTDKQASITTLNMAAVGKPLISQKSAVEISSELFELDPDEEWVGVLKAAQAQADKDAEMFPPPGGKASLDDMPAGGEPRGPHAGPRKDGNRVDDLDAPELQLSGINPGAGPTPKKDPPAEKKTPDQLAVLTVNEVRQDMGKPPLPDPIGAMTVAEFKAHVAAKGTAVGEATGQEEAAKEQGGPKNAPAPPPGAGGPSGVPKGMTPPGTTTFDREQPAPPEGFGPGSDQ